MVGWDGNTSSSSRVKYTGFLSRKCMFNEMSKSSVGLIPWKKHWLHVYVNPNKAYEYAHAGLFVMLTSSLKQVIEYLEDNCLTFDNYDQMVSQLNYFKDNLSELYSQRLKIFEFARSRLLWENYEKNILRAYESMRMTSMVRLFALTIIPVLKAIFFLPKYVTKVLLVVSKRSHDRKIYCNSVP